jgi:hypothetical protein
MYVGYLKPWANPTITGYEANALKTSVQHNKEPRAFW